MKLTIDIAEAACFTFLSMMKTSSPVDSNVAFTTVQTSRALHTSTSTYATEFEQAVEDGTIVADIVLSLLLRKRVHIIWGDLLEEIYVLVGVELCHFMASSWLRAL